MSIFAPTSKLAAGRNLVSNHTDVFVSCADGTLAVCSVSGNGIWQPPLPICAPGIVYSSSTEIALFSSAAESVIAIADLNGALNLYSRTVLNGGWQYSPITPDGATLPGASLAFTTSPDGALAIAFVDAAGKLSVCTRAVFGDWTTQALTPAGFAIPGTFVAASTQSVLAKAGFPPQFTAIASVYAVNVSGALQHFWLGSSGSWQQDQMSPENQFHSSSAIAVLERGTFAFAPETNIFVVDGDGALNVFLGDTGQWQVQKLTAAGFTVAGASVAATSSGDGANAFVADVAEALHVFSSQGGGPWSNQFTSGSGLVAPAASLVATPQFGAASGTTDPVDVVFVDTTRELTVFTSAGAEPQLWFGKALLAPDDDLATCYGSSSNVILSNYPLAIPIVTVTVTITEDIVFAEGSPSRAFGLQLNCYSYAGAYFAWQQYIIRGGIHADTTTTNLYATCNHWDVNLQPAVVIDQFLTSLPVPRIPAGYRFAIEIIANGVGAIGTVSQSVTDDSGTLVAESITDLLSAKNQLTQQNVTEDQLSPVIGFQLDVVGFSNGSQADLISGAGFISYDSFVPLFAGQGKLAPISYIATAETSDVRYEFLSKVPSLSVSQSFASIAAVAPRSPAPRPPMPLKSASQPRALHDIRI